MERITLNMVPTGVLEICHASQYDIGREIRFDLIDGTDDFVLSGDEDITIFIRDFDGNLIESSAPNTSSNYVVWTSSEGELDVSGPAICELRVTKDDDVLGSANFIMEIEADAYDGAGVQVETVGPDDICAFETNLPEPLQSIMVDVVATGGNGTPDNPIPINGYTEANITRCGVNLFDGAWSIIGSWHTADNFIPVKVGQTFYVYTPNVPSGENLYCDTYDATKTLVESNKVMGRNATFTIPNGVAYIKIKLWNEFDTTNICINYPATDTTYHTYNGNTVTIAFGKTVYGGVLDVTRGKLKPCIEYPSYNGETLSGRWLSSEATYVEGTTPPTGSQVVSLDDYGSDIDLTPEVISAVAGTNNVFADCGQTTVKYLKAGV